MLRAGLQIQLLWRPDNETLHPRCAQIIYTDATLAYWQAQKWRTTSPFT